MKLLPSEALASFLRSYEDVHDLQRRLVHAAVEMVEEHLLGEIVLDAWEVT